MLSDLLDFQWPKIKSPFPPFFFLNQVQSSIQLEEISIYQKQSDLYMTPSSDIQNSPVAIPGNATWGFG